MIRQTFFRIFQNKKPQKKFTSKSNFNFCTQQQNPLKQTQQAKLNTYFIFLIPISLFSLYGYFYYQKQQRQKESKVLVEKKNLDDERIEQFVKQIKAKQEEENQFKRQIEDDQLEKIIQKIIKSQLWNDEEKIQKLFEKSIEISQDKNITNKQDIAQKIFQEILKIDKNHIKALFNSAILYREVQQNQKALENLEIVEKILNKQVQVAEKYIDKSQIGEYKSSLLLEKGKTLIRLNKFKDAIKHFDQVINGLQNNISNSINNLTQLQAIFQKSLVLVMENKQEESLALLEQIKNKASKELKSTRDFQETQFQYGILLQSSGKHEEAIIIFEDNLQINPDQVSVWIHLGISQGAIQDYENSIYSYKNAINIDPSYSTTYFNLGNSYMHINDYENAQFSFKKAIALQDPSLVPSFYYLNTAVSLQGIERLQESVEYLDKALEKDPKYIQAYLNKGIILAHLQKNDLAKECFEKALDVNPTFPPIYINLGHYYITNNQKEQALEIYNKGLIKTDNNIEIQFKKALLLIDLGKHHEALETLNQANKKSPNNKKISGLKQTLEDQIELQKN